MAENLADLTDEERWERRRQIQALAQEHGIHIDRRTATTCWIAGHTTDYGLAVEVLPCKARRARETRRVSAGTSAG